MLLTARAVPLTAAPATTAVVDTAAPATAAVVRTTTQPDNSWASATTRISELVRMDASASTTQQAIVSRTGSVTRSGGPNVIWMNDNL
jgi:hypothetical protein